MQSKSVSLFMLMCLWACSHSAVKDKEIASKPTAESSFVIKPQITTAWDSCDFYALTLDSLLQIRFQDFKPESNFYLDTICIGKDITLGKVIDNESWTVYEAYLHQDGWSEGIILHDKRDTNSFFYFSWHNPFRYLPLLNAFYAARLSPDFSLQSQIRSLTDTGIGIGIKQGYTHPFYYIHCMYNADGSIKETGYRMKDFVLTKKTTVGYIIERFRKNKNSKTGDELVPADSRFAYPDTRHAWIANGRYDYRVKK